MGIRIIERGENMNKTELVEKLLEIDFTSLEFITSVNPSYARCQRYFLDADAIASDALSTINSIIDLMFEFKEGETIRY